MTLRNIVRQGEVIGQIDIPDGIDRKGWDALKAKTAREYKTPVHYLRFYTQRRKAA